MNIFGEEITIYNKSSSTIYYGPTGVTTSTGIPIQPEEVVSLQFRQNANYAGGGRAMNIFAAFNDPYMSAQHLDDKRVVKMVLESAQILSTVISMYDPEFHQINGLYAPTYLHHPCVKWTAENLNHFRWLLLHFDSLCSEYSRRYGRKHKSQNLSRVFWTYHQIARPSDLPEVRPTYFCNCTSYAFGETIDRVHLAYRLYLKDKWQEDAKAGREPRWNGETADERGGNGYGF